MSQYQSPFGQPTMSPDAEPPKTSGLAVTALVFSLIFFCPITTILAPILGAIAFATIGSDPKKKGKGMAIAAIILGLIFTTGQYFVGKMAWDVGMGWLKFVMQGPESALQKGFAGDIPGFKAEFFGGGASATDAEAKAFIEALRSRYGEFTGARFDEQSGQRPQGQPGKANMPFPYILTFGGKSVNAETELWFADQSTGAMMTKLGYIKVFDSDGGTLVYPTGAASPGPSETGPLPSGIPSSTPGVSDGD
jgi:hypothetical protein